MQDLDVLKIVLERLNKSGIEYMLTGSMALSYYVQPRMTRGIDIVIDITKEDVDKIYELFKDDFYIDKESITDSIKKQSSFNIIYFDFPMKFDFIIRKDTPYRRLEFERRQKIEAEGIKTFIVSIEDLILSKLDWARDSRSEMQLNEGSGNFSCFSTPHPEERSDEGSHEILQPFGLQDDPSGKNR